jgi:tellurite resistance protein TehA-like permease
VRTRARPRYVDVANPALAIDCPRCGLRTARFMEFCRNCGYALWPNGVVATAAFRAWRDYDPVRAPASRFDLAIPDTESPPLIDYEERAHELGIHIFPSSNFPFLISLGMLILALAIVPFHGEPAVVHYVIAAVGAVVFLAGVVGWVLVEDVRMYPSEVIQESHGPPHGHVAGGPPEHEAH